METPLRSPRQTQGGTARNGAVAFLWACTLTTVGVVWLGSPMASVAPPTPVPPSMATLTEPAPLHVECVNRQDRVATDQTRQSTPTHPPARQLAPWQVDVQSAAAQATFVPTPQKPATTPCVATGQPALEPSR